MLTTIDIRSHAICLTPPHGVSCLFNLYYNTLKAYCILRPHQSTYTLISVQQVNSYPWWVQSALIKIFKII